MTNAEAKQEAIRKAWGKYWEEVKDHIDEYGWCDNTIVHYNEDLGLDTKDLDFWTDLNNERYRPQSLRGLAGNNGWTRIEIIDSNLPTDTYSNLPTDDIKYKVYMFKGEFNHKEVKRLFLHQGAQYFKPIEEEKPPIW